LTQPEHEDKLPDHHVAAACIGTSVICLRYEDTWKGTWMYKTLDPDPTQQCPTSLGLLQPRV